MTKLSGPILVTISLLLAACGSTGSNEITTAAADAQTADSAAGAQADPVEAPADDLDHLDDAAQADVGGMVDGDDEPMESGSVVAAEGTLRSVLLEKTLDRSSRLASARFEGEITMVGAEGSEMPGEISLKFAGAYDLANDASEVSMDFSGIVDALGEGGGGAEAAMFAGFFAEPLQVITIGDRSWMKWGLISLFTGTEGMWLEGDSSEAGDMTAGFGFGGAGSPTALLDLLADADADVERVGTETVRGTTTTHYRALVDVAALVRTMSAGELADFEAEFAAGTLPVFPMEFWIDDDGQLFRWVLDLSDPVLLAESDGEIESARFVFEIWDHGADLGIAPPPADQIVSEDEIDFGFGDLAG